MKNLTIPALAIVLSLSAGTALANHEPGHEGKHHKGGMRDHFAMMDTNKDGVITKAEFTSKSSAMFDKMDANHDGKLTKAEGKAAREKWHKEHGDMKRGDKKHRWGKDGKHHKDMKRDGKWDGHKCEGHEGMARREGGASNVTLHGTNAPESKAVLQR